jgi:glycosyltransferase involved in cell wall biosynthesis
MTDTTRPLGSVVIPAHNEQSVIAECLAPLAAAAADGRLEVVVVANGCTDGTADVARSFPGVIVLELPVGSKPAALRAGEQAVHAMPRMYLDADVVLPLESALTVLAQLSGDGSTGPLAGRPPVRYDPSGSPLLVRRYYRARAQIPAVLGSLWGAGVYALSEAGRARFDQFPDMVADDLWVDQLFEADEVEIFDCPPVTVNAPRHVRDLLAVLRRTYRGKSEHQTMNVGLARETQNDTARDVMRLARRSPAGLVDAATYTGMVVTARIAHRLSTNDSWERDESSRER